MDKLLDHLWRSGKRPFDNSTLHFGDSLSPERMTEVLKVIVAELHETFGDEQLRVNADWHDHDGLLLDSSPCSWEEVHAWIRTTDSLRRSCSDDWQVHCLVYPLNCEFCLRYWIDTDEIDCACLVDVSASAEVIQHVSSRLQSNGFETFEVEKSHTYFASRYAG